MGITLTETEKQIVARLNHSMVTVEFLEEWLNRHETNFDGRNPYGAEMMALAQGYYSAVQRLASFEADGRSEETKDADNGSWQAICRCRLCGEVFRYNPPVDREEWVFDDLDNIIDGKEAESTDQVRLVNTHDCKGLFEGSHGLADFLGYKKIE